MSVAEKYLFHLIYNKEIKQICCFDFKLFNKHNFLKECDAQVISCFTTLFVNLYLVHFKQLIQVGLKYKNLYILHSKLLHCKVKNPDLFTIKFQIA